MPSGKSPGISTGAVGLDELDELVGLDEDLEDELEELVGLEDELDDELGADDEALSELLKTTEDLLDELSTPLEAFDDELEADELADEDELSELLETSEDVLKEELSVLLDFSEELDELTELLGVSKGVEVFAPSLHAVNVRSIAAAVIAFRILLFFIPLFLSINCF